MFKSLCDIIIEGSLVPVELGFVKMDQLVEVVSGSLGNDVLSVLEAEFNHPLDVLLADVEFVQSVGQRLRGSGQISVLDVWSLSHEL